MAKRVTLTPETGKPIVMEASNKIAALLTRLEVGPVFSNIPYSLEIRQGDYQTRARQEYAKWLHEEILPELKEVLKA